MFKTMVKQIVRQSRKKSTAILPHPTLKISKTRRREDETCVLPFKNRLGATEGTDSSKGRLEHFLKD